MRRPFSSSFVAACALVVAPACGSVGDLRLDRLFHRTVVHPSSIVDVPSARTGRKVEDVEGKTLVLAFVALGSPIANAYATELESIADEYRPRGVELLLVVVDRSATADEVRAHSIEHGYDLPIVIDRERALCNALAIATSPEVVVERGSDVLYRGRIDDRFTTPAAERATKHDLRDALDAILAGGMPAAPATEAIGDVVE